MWFSASLRQSPEFESLSIRHYREKTEYFRCGWSLIAHCRHGRGFSLWILLDEHHYILGHSDGDHLLGFQLDGYPLVAYRPHFLRIWYRTDEYKSRGE